MDDRADELVSILRVENAEIAARWYSRLGLVLEGVHRFEPGLPAYAFLKRDATDIHLSVGNRLRVGCRNEEDDPGFAPTITSG